MVLRIRSSKKGRQHNGKKKKKKKKMTNRKNVSEELLFITNLIKIRSLFAPDYVVHSFMRDNKTGEQLKIEF